MAKSFFTGTDAELYTGSRHFDQLINATPAVYGLTTAQTDSYSAATTEFGEAYLAAINPETRTRSKVATKNDKRQSLRTITSNYAKIIDAQALSDAQRIDLGLAIRKAPAPRPTPATATVVEFVGVSGRTATVRLRDADRSKRGRSPDAIGASVWTYVGEQPPATQAGWTFYTNTNKTTLDITFDASVPSGATVWVCAFWIGSRMESGPAGVPASTNLPGGNAMPASGAQAMRIAA